MKHVIPLGVLGLSLAAIGTAPRIAALATTTTPIEDLALVEEAVRSSPMLVQNEGEIRPLPIPRTVWPSYPRTVWPYPRTVWPYPRTVWPYSGSSDVHEDPSGAREATASLKLPAPLVWLTKERR